jgi:predicted lipoprotein with Yx(FWY)xxD motif
VNSCVVLAEDGVPRRLAAGRPFSSDSCGVVLALAACGGGSGGASGNSPGPTGSSPGTTTVSAEQIGDAGSVLADSAGQALYASDEETGGTVLCTDACLSFWTPLTISGGAPTGSSLPGKLDVVERPDGARQVTYDGMLLYSFNEDKPGEVSGDGYADAFAGQQFPWHVVHSDSAADSSGGGTSTSGGPYGY